MKLAAALILLTVTTGVVVTHHRRPTQQSEAASAPAGTVLVQRDTVPRGPGPNVRASRSTSRPSLRIVPDIGTASDITEYCSTGNRNAAGRWPQLGDVAVLDRTIPFGTRVLIDGNVYTVEDWIGHGSDYDIYAGSDAGCEARALRFGRQHLRVVVER